MYQMLGISMSIPNALMAIIIRYLLAVKLANMLALPIASWKYASQPNYSANVLTFATKLLYITILPNLYYRIFYRALLTTTTSISCFFNALSIPITWYATLLRVILA
jgi:hypothetical protein